MSAAATKPVVKMLRLCRMPIFEQLQLEEALLRSTPHNWMLLNDGTPGVSIVMGISGKVQEMVHADQAAWRGVQVVKRFTGGGTVVVDGSTVFSTLIMQADALPEVECFPAPIMRWTEALYAPAFAAAAPAGAAFALREHDYVFGERKFGGNAQAITGRRWLHHTSLLWDFDPDNMALLRPPTRQPKYRENREHGDFVVPLREFMPNRGALLDALLGAAHSRFVLEEAPLGEAQAALAAGHVRGNAVVDLSQHVSSGMAATIRGDWLPSEPGVVDR